MGGSKDCSDAVAGVVGYLSQYGHAVTTSGYQATVNGGGGQISPDAQAQELIRLLTQYEGDDPPAMLAID